MKRNLIEELRSQKLAIESEMRGVRTDSADYQRLNNEWSDVCRSLKHEQAEAGRIVKSNLRAGKPYATEAGAAFGAGDAASTIFAGGRMTARDEALRTIERHYPSVLSSDAASALDTLTRENDSPTAFGARYLSAVGDENYNSAFGKILADPTTGHLRFTPQEHSAMHRVRQLEAERSMNEGTGSAGQFALPLSIDPTIIMSSTGAINPIRQMATVTQISTYTWRGVSSDGITASYQVEGGTATDNSPTLAQPTVTPARAQAFVPFSFEIGQDWVGLQTEMAKLFSDARDVLESGKFWNGSGTTEPQGLITGLGTAQKITTAGSAVVAVADIYSLRQAVPARFYESAQVAWHPNVGDSVYQLVKQADASNASLMPDGRGGQLLGWNVRQWSSMDSSATTTGQKVIVAGDFRTAYRIIDRIGTSIELIPNLTVNGYPTGQRGLYAFWRNSAVVQVPNAVRFLQVK